MTQDHGAAGSADGAAAGATAGKLPSDPARLEQLIARKRDDLASTIDELAYRVHPKEVARRSAADARGRLRAFTSTPEGGLRTERLAAIAAAVAAVVALIGLIRRSRHRGGR
jgi:Protein of unknown function (DUF3618)